MKLQASSKLEAWPTAEDTFLYQTLITKDNTDLEFTGNLQAFKQASSPQYTVDLGLLQAQY